MLLTELTLKTFTGSAIRPYLSSLARLSVEVFREYPFLCDTHAEIEIDLLKKYALSEDSIAVILFEGSTVVGAATGIPLSQESESLKKPFKQQNLDVSKYYHFGEALLLKHYRGRGVGHHFYELREERAKKFGIFDSACFYTFDRTENNEYKDQDFYPLDDFWRKRGFVHHKELITIQRWKDLSEETESDKECSFWIKKL